MYLKKITHAVLVAFVLAFTVLAGLTMTAQSAFACGGLPCDDEPEVPVEPETPKVSGGGGSIIPAAPCDPYAAERKKIDGSEVELANVYSQALAKGKWVKVWVKNDQVIGVIYEGQPTPEGARVYKLTAAPADGRVCVKPHYN